VAHAGDDLGLGPVGGRAPAQLADGEEAVVFGPRDQDRDLDPARPGPHHQRVEERRPGLVLQPSEGVVDQLLGGVGGEEQLADQRRGGDEGPQAQRQVGRQHRRGMADGQAGHDRGRSAAWGRGQQYRPPGGAVLQVALDDQSAQGVADQHRRLGEPRRGLVDVLDVVVDAVPDPARRTVVAAQPHGVDLVAVSDQPPGHAVPAPRAVPGAMDQQDLGHVYRLLHPRSR
jgi:hypothetical protein